MNDQELKAKFPPNEFVPLDTATIKDMLSDLGWVLWHEDPDQGRFRARKNGQEIWATSLEKLFVRAGRAEAK